MTGKLTVQADGRVTGPASIRYNDPFPCVNGSFGSGAMTGVLEHTMVGDLPGTIAWFNNPQAQASAHFGVDQQGAIHQFGPIGKGWMAWHAAAANAAWYGIEFADNGNPANPLTPAQITAAAQLVECLAAFAGFPLQASDSPSAKGYGWHGMGGAAWGGHFDCPGDTRKAQRPQIIALAKAIRAGGTPAPPARPPTVPSVREWVTAGMSSLPQLAAQQHSTPAAVLALTMQHSPGGVLPPEVAAWVDEVFAGTADPRNPMPKGLRLWVPGA